MTLAKINSHLKLSAHKVNDEVLKMLSIDYSFDNYDLALANKDFVESEMIEFSKLFKDIAISNGLTDLSLDVVVLPHAPIMYLNLIEPASMHRMIDLSPLYRYLGGKLETLKANEMVLNFIKQKNIYSFSSSNYLKHLSKR
jgi:hypothetical protein